MLEQGIFSNGECALVKLRNDAANSNCEFTLVVSQHGGKREFNYTLQVYTQREAIVVALATMKQSFCKPSKSGRLVLATITLL